MAGEFTGKVAAVTGAARGIGDAIVQRFLEECARRILPFSLHRWSEWRLAFRAVDAANRHLINSELARRLGWTRSKLIRFLDHEEAQGRITRSISSTGRALVAVSDPVRTAVRTPEQLPDPSCRTRPRG